MSIPGLERWLETAQGRYVCAWESASMDNAIADVFGFNALQLGLPQCDFLHASRIPLRQKAAEAGTVDVLLRTRCPALRVEQHRPRDPAACARIQSGCAPDPARGRAHPDPGRTLDHPRLQPGFAVGPAQPLRPQRQLSLAWQLPLPDTAQGLAETARFRGRPRQLRLSRSALRSGNLAQALALHGTRRRTLVGLARRRLPVACDQARPRACA